VKFRAIRQITLGIFLFSLSLAAETRKIVVDTSEVKRSFKGSTFESYADFATDIAKATSHIFGVSGARDAYGNFKAELFNQEGHLLHEFNFSVGGAELGNSKLDGIDTAVILYTEVPSSYGMDSNVTAMLPPPFHPSGADGISVYLGNDEFADGGLLQLSFRGKLGTGAHGVNRTTGIAALIGDSSTTVVGVDYWPRSIDVIANGNGEYRVRIPFTIVEE
jgi:hypothetical protein